jgi:uncharacterized protein with HEPN domain
LKDYSIFLKDILSEIEETILFSKDIDLEEFEKDRKTQKAVIRGLEVIGEAMNKIPKDIQSNYPDIVWRQWIDFRNRLIHAYHNVDLEIVWDCVQNELPLLQKQITLILNDLQN